MLIDQKELSSLCLTTPALNELTAQVINQLNGITNPLLRYATARSLKNVFEKSASDANAAAVDFCQTHNIGLDNVMFQNLGLKYVLEYKCDYRWGNNDTDKKNMPAGFKKAFAEVMRLQKELDDAKHDLSVAKEKIELAHPKMEPVNPRWVLKFLIRDLPGSLNSEDEIDIDAIIEREEKPDE